MVADDDAMDVDVEGVDVEGVDVVGCCFVTWFLYVLGVFKNFLHIGQAYP